jgi:hypothetical protein
MEPISQGRFGKQRALGSRENGDQDVLTRHEFEWLNRLEAAIGADDGFNGAQHDRDYTTPPDAEPA